MTKQPRLYPRTFFTLILFKLCPRRHNIFTQRVFFCSPPRAFQSHEYLAYLSICSPQRPLSPRLSSMLCGPVERKYLLVYPNVLLHTPSHRHICYLHVLRLLRTYSSAATRLFNEIVALVSLIVTEVGLVQGAQLRRVLDLGVVTTRQFSLPTCEPHDSGMSHCLSTAAFGPHQSLGYLGILGSSFAVGETRLEPRGHD